MRENGVASDKAIELEVLTRIKNFSGMNKLKKEALKVKALCTHTQTNTHTHTDRRTRPCAHDRTHTYAEHQGVWRTLRLVGICVCVYTDYRCQPASGRDQWYEGALPW